jgi:hypothetical protein
MFISLSSSIILRKKKQNRVYLRIRPNQMRLILLVALLAILGHATQSNHTIELAISCDNTCDVWIAGKQVLTTAQSPSWEVVHYLRVDNVPPGEHVVAVRAVDWHVVAMIIGTVALDGRAVGWTGGAGWQFANVSLPSAGWMSNVSVPASEWTPSYTRCWEHPAYPANSLIQRTTVNGSTPYYVWSPVGCNYPQAVTLYARFVVSVAGESGRPTTTSSSAMPVSTSVSLETTATAGDTNAASSPPPPPSADVTAILIGGGAMSVLVAVSAMMAYAHRRRHQQRALAQKSSVGDVQVICGENPLYESRWANGENPLYENRR